MAWFLNPALTRFRNEVNSRWPHRDKTSDGTIGDAAHQASNSDHNPDPDGSVDAWDMDVDGVPVAQVIAAALKHESIWYVIYNRRITSRDMPGGLGVWHPYTGSSPHTEHVHFNTRQSRERSNKPWFTEQEADDVTPAQDKQLQIDAWRLDALTFGRETVAGGPLKGESMWLVKTINAISRALAGLPGSVGAALKNELDEIDASVAAARADIAEVDEHVLAQIGSTDNAQEQAALLRALLGDRAHEVGALLAAGADMPAPRSSDETRSARAVATG